MQINEALKVLQAPVYVLERLNRCNQLYSQDHTITEANYSKVTLSRQQLAQKISHDATMEAYNLLEQMRLKTEYKDNLVVMLEWLGDLWRGLFAKLYDLKSSAVCYTKAKKQEADAEAEIKDNLTPKYETGAFIELREIGKATVAARKAGASSAVKQLSEPTEAEWQSYRTQKAAILSVENMLKRLQGLPFIEDNGTVQVDSYGNIYVDSKGNVISRQQAGILITDGKGNVSIDAKGNLVDFQQANASYCPSCDHILVNSKCINPKCPDKAKVQAQHCKICDHVIFNGKCSNPKCPGDSAGNVKRMPEREIRVKV